MSGKRPREPKAEKKVKKTKKQKLQATDGLWFDKKHRCYKRGSVPLKGVQKWLRETFYPHYKYPDELDTSVEGQQKAAAARKGGLERGTRVDKELGQWCDGGQWKHKPHPFTYSATEAFKRRGWVPIKAQTVVAMGRLGTGIDLLFSHKGTQWRWSVPIGHESYQGAHLVPLFLFP